MINYDNACKKLDEFMVELLDKGFAVPQHLFDDLKSARNLINIYRAVPSELAQAMDSSPYLQSVEMNLLSIAETEISKDYADEWQREIIAAYQGNAAGGAKPAAFITGVPKGDYWVRINTSEVSIGKEHEKLLAELRLQAKAQDDSYVLIHGRKDDVKIFLKEIRQKAGGEE